MQHETNAFSRSLAVQREAASQGFDWPEIAGVLDKVREELDEIIEALGRGDQVHACSEFGDLLFTVLNLSRFMEVDVEQELDRATARFTSRYARLKSILSERGKRVDQVSLEYLNRVWEEVKRDESEKQKKA